MIAVDSPGGRTGQWAKIAAFVRRDFLIAWSYRIAFLGDLVALGVGSISFYFVGLMVDEQVLPIYDGRRATYMEFAAVGIVFGLFTSIGLSRVGAALRREQFMGTLESVLATPTSATLIQFGSIAYELIYLPLRTTLLFAILVALFGLAIEPSGILPATLLFLAFMPFVWGLGLVGAGASISIRGAGTGLGVAVGLMTLFSGAYFPVGILPSWLEATTVANPIAITLGGMREALLGGGSVSSVSGELLILAPLSAVSVAAGTYLFRVALRREQRAGTLGMY